MLRLFAINCFVRLGCRGSRLALALMLAFLLSVGDKTSAIRHNDLDAILEQMPLEHKIGQMFMVNLFGPELTGPGRTVLESWRPGAVLILDSNIQSPESLVSLINSYQQTIVDAGGIPLFVATDQEGGPIARLREGFTAFPPPMALTAANDLDLVHRVGAAMAEEMRAVGVNMNLAPVADLQTNIDNPIIGRRSPGSHPDAVGATVAALIGGMQEGGVLATAKHFPGHGSTSEDSHLELPQIAFDFERLMSVELPPFRDAIEASVSTIMVGHLWLSEFDIEQPIPASLSSRVITDLLRGELDFDGIIMTDALDMDAVDTRYSSEESAIRAVLAGVDLIAIGAHVGEMTQMRAMQALVDAVREGIIPEERIDQSVRRIIRAKHEFGLLNWEPLDPVATQDRLNLDAHDTLVENLLSRSVTLVFDAYDHVPVRNRDDVTVVYPANRSAIRRICDGLGLDVGYLGVSAFPTDSEISAIRSLAARVDTLVFFTIDAYQNERYQQLVRAAPPEKVVVIALRSPYDVLRFPQIGAYLVTYSPVDHAISGVCMALSGRMTPQGALAVDLQSE